MSLTVARPVKKVQTRKVISINQVSNSYYEVVGDTGNVYNYDAMFDCCNCPAGVNGKDCYHAKAVREQLEYEKLNETEYLTSIPTTDIGGMVHDLGLTAKFKGNSLIYSIYGGQAVMLIEVFHKDYHLCDVKCIGGAFFIQNNLTGYSKLHTPKTGEVMETLKYNLTKLRNSSQYWESQAAKESLFGDSSWGTVNAGL